jgi:hypothetical protein
MIEAAAQPTDFTADFSFQVTGLNTITLGKKLNVVKQVDWILVGTEAGQTFELPQTTQLPDPSDSFTPLEKLTEKEVIAWIESNEPRLAGIKAHIQYVLDKEVAKASLVKAAMPWAPAPEEALTPAE